MLARVSEWIQRVSNGWVALAALVTFVLFTALVLPGQSQNADQAAGDAGSPDLSFYYSAGDLYQMAEAYGELGRDAYIKARFTFDLIWPVVYGLFLATAISWVSGKAFAPGSQWNLINLFPVFGVAFDYLENISTSIIMQRYPAQTPIVDVLAGVFTALKWSLLGASFVLLLVGIVLAVWRWIRARGQ